MHDLARWLPTNLYGLVISSSVAIASAVVLVWARRLAGRFIARLPAAAPWPRLTEAMRSALRLSPLWIALLSLYAALLVSHVPTPLRERIARLLLTLFLLSLGVAAVRFARRASAAVAEHIELPHGWRRTSASVLASIIGIITALMLLEVWGVPTAPMLVVLVLVAILTLVALRDVLPTLVAAFQVSALDQVQPGDYLKLESGEQGTVEQITWRDLVLKGVDGSHVRVPLSKVVRLLVSRRGPAPKQAETPLQFVYRSHLRELTGLRARNLTELIDGLRKVPDSSIYYHTHEYLEEHQYLVPSPANAFAEWVGRSLGLDEVAEALESINVLEVARLATLRASILEVLQNAIAQQGDARSALPGHELHFVSSVTFVTPCPYTASNLSELAAVIPRLSLSSLYFHLFEARLLGSKDADSDIATWLRRQLGESELAAEVGRMNAADYTFEGLRDAVLQRIEARL